MAEELPPSLAAALRPALPELAQEMIAAIGREVPDYARPLEGPFGRALQLGVERALARFVDGIEDPAAGDGGARENYVAGRGEMRAGRSLDALLSAYRLGARLAWEHFVAPVRRPGRARTLYRLATAIFDYIDGISAESIEGFTQERAAAESEAHRRRRALARLLARDDVAAEEVRDLARLAGWARPATLSALVVGDGTGDDEPDTDRLASLLGGGAIAAAEGARAIAWIPDPQAPGGAPAQSALDGAPAALGPAVVLERAPFSLVRARAAHALALDGRLTAARSWWPTSTCPPCCCMPATGRSRPTSPPAPWRRSTTCAPAPAAACDDPASLARPSRPGHPGGRRPPRASADRPLPRAQLRELLAIASRTPTRASSSASSALAEPSRRLRRSSRRSGRSTRAGWAGKCISQMKYPAHPSGSGHSLPSVSCQRRASPQARRGQRAGGRRGPGEDDPPAGRARPAGGAGADLRGRQAVGAQRLGAHVAAGEQQPDEPAPRRRVGHRHARYAEKVTVTVDTTVGGIWQRWRLRVPQHALAGRLALLEHRGADGAAAEAIGSEPAEEADVRAVRRRRPHRRSPRSARA